LNKDAGTYIVDLTLSDGSLQSSYLLFLEVKASQNTESQTDPEYPDDFFDANEDQDKEEPEILEPFGFTIGSFSIYGTLLISFDEPIEPPDVNALSPQSVSITI